MSKRWILRLVLSIMLLAALSAAVCATDEENWYDAEQQEYFWEEEQLETVFPDENKKPVKENEDRGGLYG